MNLITSKLGDNDTYNQIKNQYLNNKRILQESLDNNHPLVLKLISLMNNKPYTKCLS